jgi:hypothetical protein
MKGKVIKRFLLAVEELSTDSYLLPGTQKIHSQNMDLLDRFVTAVFARYSFQIVNCNEFLRQTTDAKLTARGVDALKAEITTYRAEAFFKSK